MTVTKQQLIDDLMARVAELRAEARNAAPRGNGVMAAGRLNATADGVEWAAEALRDWEPPAIVGVATGGSAGNSAGVSAGGGGGGGQPGGGTSSGTTGAAPGGSAGGGAAGPPGECPVCGRGLYLLHRVRVTHQDGSAVCALPPGAYNVTEPDPDIIRGIERVTGEKYRGDGRWDS